jgi:hypothetical protein
MLIISQKIISLPTKGRGVAKWRDTGMAASHDPVNNTKRRRVK